MEQLKDSLKPRVEEAVKVVTTMSPNKPWFTQTLMHKKLDRWPYGGALLHLDRHQDELVYSVIHEGEKVVAVVPHKLHNSDRKKPIEAGLSAQETRKHNLHFRMEHGSKSLATEKRLLKEIKESQKQKEKDSLVLFCAQCPQCEADIEYAKEHLSRTANYTRHCMYQNWWWHIAHYGQCGIVLLKKDDKAPTAIDISTATAGPFVRGKTWTSMVSIKINALDEQLKLAGEEVEQSSKTLLALRHGSKRGEPERTLVDVEKELSDALMMIPGLRRRNRFQPHQCILEFIRKQQA